MAKFGWKESGIAMFRWSAKVGQVSDLPGCPLAFVVLLAAAGWLLAQETPVFRSDVNLVRVLATAKTQAGALVGNLTKDDFEVYDNGVRQEIMHFQRQTDQPLSVALVVDVSGSTAIDLNYEIESGGKFLKALLGEANPEDRAPLFSFD